MSNSTMFAAFATVPGLQHKLVKSPISLSTQDGNDGPTGPAPGFGEHTEQVLESLGYSGRDVAQLKADGVVH